MSHPLCLLPFRLLISWQKRPGKLLALSTLALFILTPFVTQGVIHNIHLPVIGNLWLIPSRSDPGGGGPTTWTS